MTKIHSLQATIKLARKFHTMGKKIVLAGGCFDLLHVGHISFFEQAKKQGDLLFLLVESDATVRNLKGPNRPIHTQSDRAKMLAALEAVDSVCLLPPMHTNKAYDKLVLAIKPAIIATTSGDLYHDHKKRQAKLVDGKVITIKRILPHSTTNLAKQITQDFYL